MRDRKKYYQKNRITMIEKQKERYAKKNPRKYKKYYLVVSHDGTEYKFERGKDLAEFFGYSVSTVTHVERLQGKFGYTIQKVY